MNAQVEENVFKRVLWLYGLYSLLNLFSFLLGYHFLPEGFMRGSPYSAIGSFVASASSFWSEFSLTLLFNLSVVIVVCILTNLQQFRHVPIGYIVPVVLGIVSGLVSGTNSFAASDLKQFNALDGMALGMGIGGIEMLAYVLVISATANIGLYNYESLKQWQGKRLKNIRQIKLSVSEMFCLGLGILMIIFAAYRETVMAFAQ
ncbi:hypothetical protein Calab_1025 [Caldithrix abyssi DSM 13497]|uniref:Uncharacterized protein n=1 Tax=Caldithrix abyssi DSM 13497 TaxID=880073 RepID=H1XVT2_CALAY|nr:hypothetical protein [Caldithrix abyssi]EHO40659.1 hypothetical protein Calab_1025 [Caldithrix abyssi DSM 13497]